jgi:hypothetical protein
LRWHLFLSVVGEVALTAQRMVLPQAQIDRTDFTAGNDLVAARKEN